MPPPLTGFKFMNQKVVECVRGKNLFKVIVFSLKGNNSKFIIFKQLINSFIMVFYIIKLIYYLICNRFDFVYFTISPVYRFKRDFIFVILLKIFKVKLVYHLHGKGIRDYTEKSKFLKILYKYAYKNVSVICLSERLYSDISLIHRGSKYILNNGIMVSDNFKDKHIKQNQVPHLLFLSNLIKSKGVYVLLDALKILNYKKIDFICNFVGSCSYDISYQSFIKKLSETGLQNNVRYLGAMHGLDKNKILNNSDIFVYPTYEDAFPLVLLEAQAFSLPVITTDEGAIPEIIDDGMTGFIIEKRNPIQLAEKIEILIKNEKARKSFGQAARKKYLNKYTLQIFENNLINIFNDILIND